MTHDALIDTHQHPVPEFYKRAMAEGRHFRQRRESMA